MVLLAILALLSLAPPQATYGRPIRVACLGDSITFGSLVVDREHNSYPRQLGHRLGPGFEVRGFGAGGRTLLRDTRAPYTATDEYRAALEWEPDVAVVMLGTNDTCLNESRRCWDHEADLERDARALVRELREANDAARILLASPTAMHWERPGLKQERRDDLRERSGRLPRVRAALRAVAAETPGVEYVDMSRVLDPGHTVDGVHTTPFGAGAIAERIEAAITARPAPGLGIRSALSGRGIDATAGEFHGFPRLDFRLPDGGPACVVVAPHVAVEGYPWIWRARFWGHEPALDLALLGRGYHLAYCDVAGLFGGPEAIARWDAFHDLARALGLGARPVLEGMSRGGLVVVNWAASNPESATAIYGDNPVADFRSWPGGRSGKRSDADWKRCLAAYGLSEDEAEDYSRMPVDRLEPIARANVPLLLVLGTADDVVPPAENGELLATRYRALGGPVHVWRKPGLGHHPHGLDPVAPLLRAVMRSGGTGGTGGTGVEPTTRALPSAEYRGGPAGWGGGTWWGQLERHRALAAEHPDIEIVFLGDSITQGLTGSADRVAREGGSRAIDRAFGARGAVSLGLSGDRTEHLLFRIEHGALAMLEPRVIVLQIGVNNVNSGGHTGDETGAGVVAVVRALREHEPQARIVISGPFPTGGDPRHPGRLALDRVHEIVAPLGDDETVFYRDLRPLFLDEDGRPNDRMSGDHVHINDAGRRAWLEAIAPLVLELCGE